MINHKIYMKLSDMAVVLRRRENAKETFKRKDAEIEDLKARYA